VLRAQAAFAMAPVVVQQQHRAGIPGSPIIMGIPQFIIAIICVQQAMNVAFMAGSMHMISQHMPSAVSVQVIFAIMHIPPGVGIIIGMVGVVVQHRLMPPHVHIIGMPHEAIAAIWLQQAMNMSFMEVSIARISHFMPFAVMLHVMFAIMQAIGIGAPEPIAPGIIPGIIVIIGIAGVIAVSFGFRGGTRRVSISDPRNNS
jgi:hypothetical protein